ncbi:helix-turn-helix domain-containing protein [Chamaesiphon polymorphus]|uniref:DNA-binding protein n=1 Tax=Chamaesiphon polymorphus CCALA 037 TaxID=2107692 RepID=A0A2T1GHS0_9CYAN|nr:helix-turn-helix domain-containing protein [Chamaesiphon polymorphus]PSB57241.1 hypothetical protein C7B77_09115 [Chamaesiphon polymorphus CCALA 037]
MLKERRDNRSSVGKDVKLLPKGKISNFPKTPNVTGFKGKTGYKNTDSNHEKLLNEYIDSRNILDSQKIFGQRDKLVKHTIQEQEKTTKLRLFQDIANVIKALGNSQATIDRQSVILDRIIAALTEPEILAELAPNDPLLLARLKGMRVKQQLLYSDGKPLQVEEVAKLLHVSKQAVEQMRCQGKLLAVSLGKEACFYPHWQFQGASVLTGLDRVLSVLAKFDSWTQLMFMKTGDLRLSNRTPLECLIAGDIDAVVVAAACYGEPNPA